MNTIILIATAIFFVLFILFLLNAVRAGKMVMGDVVSLTFILMVVTAALLTNTEYVFGIPNVL